MRRILRLTVLLVITLISSNAMKNVGAQEVVDVPAYVFQDPGEVVAVIDGDTIVVEWSQRFKDQVRIASADTPELKPEVNCLAAFAVESTAWAYNVLLGRTVWLSMTGETQDGEPVVRHGNRVLARVYLDPDRQTDFGRILVAQGFAEALEKFPVGEKYQPLEDEAKQAKRGRWGKCPESTM